MGCTRVHQLHLVRKALLHILQVQEQTQLCALQAAGGGIEAAFRPICNWTYLLTKNIAQSLSEGSQGMPRQTFLDGGLTQTTACPCHSPHLHPSWSTEF